MSRSCFFTPVSACASFKPAICLRVGQLLETWSIYFYLAVMEWSICSSPGAFHVASLVTHKPGTLLNGISFITLDGRWGGQLFHVRRLKILSLTRAPAVQVDFLGSNKSQGWERSPGVDFSVRDRDAEQHLHRPEKTFKKRAEVTWQKTGDLLINSVFGLYLFTFLSPAGLKVC